MPDGGPVRFRNKLLSALSPRDLSAISTRLVRVDLRPQQILERPDEPVKNVYFPERGIASVVATDGKSRRIEAGPFGYEGMSGMPVLLGTDRSPHETTVKMPGSAHCVSAEGLRKLLASSPSMHKLLLRYVQAFSIQTAHTLIASAVSVVETRLARWILMLHDRVEGDRIPLTHEFLAAMLSVRRPGVTAALHVLEGEGFIRSERGLLTIRDRAGLEKRCGSLYGIPEREYERLLAETG